MRALLVIATLLSIVVAQEPADVARAEVVPSDVKPGYLIFLAANGSYKVSGAVLSSDQITAVAKALVAYDKEVGVTIKSPAGTSIDHMMTLMELLKKAGVNTRNIAIVVDREKNAEQGGADQPATAPDLKSEGNDKPQPEKEVAPR